jgi:hypothetical protein
MIILPTRDESERFSTPEEYFVIMNRGCSKSDFLLAAQVIPGSFAEELVERIFECLVTQAIDIGDEYQKYYSQEYSSIEEFLYWKYNVDQKTLEEIIDNLQPGDFLGHGSVSWGGEHNLGHFIMSEPGIALVAHVFDKLREGSCENKN